MKLTIKSFKKNLVFTWKKAFLLLAFFLVFALFNWMLPYYWILIIFAWPLYLLPRMPIIASVIEILYAYILATLLLLLLDGTKKK